MGEAPIRNLAPKPYEFDSKRSGVLDPTTLVLGGTKYLLSAHHVAGIVTNKKSQKFKEPCERDGIT